MAVALARMAETRVALVDLDLELGSLAAMLQVKPRASIVDLYRFRAISMCGRSRLP